MPNTDVKIDQLDSVAADIDAYFDRVNNQADQPAHYLEEIITTGRIINVGKTALSNGLTHYRVRTQYYPAEAGGVVTEDYHWGDVRPVMHQSFGNDVDLERMEASHKSVVRFLVDTFLEQQPNQAPTEA